MIINRKSENFQKVYKIVEQELEKETDRFVYIEGLDTDIFVNHSFNERRSENIILQFVPQKILNDVQCTGCICEECSSTVEEKIEHILFDFFEEPEVFICQEFLQEHPDFFE